VGWVAPLTRRIVRAAAVGTVVVLGVWSCWANVGLAFIYQRAQMPFATVDDRASLVRAELVLQERLGGGVPSRTGHGDVLPEGPVPGASLFVLGDCAGVFRFDGVHWLPVEQTAATGFHPLEVTLAAAASGPQPVLSSIDDLGTTIVWAVPLDGGRVRFDYQWEPVDPDGTFHAYIETEPLRLPDHATIDLSARFDFRDGITTFLQLRSGDRLLFDGLITRLHGPVELGTQHSLPGATAMAGSVSATAAPTPLCDRLVKLGLFDR
jgi:hypothetical protein